MTNLWTMRKRWWAQIPRNGLRPWNLRWDPCMRTKYGLWLTCPMIGKSLRINGSSRGRRTLIVVLLPTKLELSQKVFWQVQGVDYDETFSLAAMLRVCWNYISDYCIIYEILQIGWQNIVSSTIFLRKGCMWYNRKVLSILKDANKYAKLQQSF